MDKLVLAINNFGKEHLVSISMDFDWFSTLIIMKRDNYEQAIRISDEEIESVNADIVIETALKNMLMEINKNYE